MKNQSSNLIGEPNWWATDAGTFAKILLQIDTENNDFFFFQNKSNSFYCSHTDTLLWNMTIILYRLVSFLFFYFEYFLEAREKEKLENAISHAWQKVLDTSVSCWIFFFFS